MVKSHILDYWEKNLRGQASILPSLEFFNPNFMSLAKPHPIWITAHKNTQEISKAIQQSRFLSGRYRSGYMSRHWDKKNPEGFCHSDHCQGIIEDTKHILLNCQQYAVDRSKLFHFWIENSDEIIHTLIKEALNSTDTVFLQFILDCSVLPFVIKAVQTHGDTILEKVFYLTRTWCFVIHRERMKFLGKWNFQ